MKIVIVSVTHKVHRLSWNRSKLMHKTENGSQNTTNATASHITFKWIPIINWPVLYRTGGHGGDCTKDKKHCCFHWELNHGLNSGLKQRWYVYGTIEGDISIFLIIVTPPRNRGGVIFLLQFVCLSVCVWVCVFVCVCVCEQNSSRTKAPIWMRFSLNSCLLHWLGPYWNWWPWVKGQGHCDRKCI